MKSHFPSQLTASMLLSAALLAAVSSTIFLKESHAGQTLVAATSGQGIDPTNTSSTAPTFGAYDPAGTFSSDQGVRIEHLFLPWEDVELSSLYAADSYAQQRGRDMLVTIEPWSWSQDWRLSPEELKSGILSGKYDGNMAAICGIAGELKSRVTIRWAQEMEETNGRFSWANWKPQDYIKAYRHVVDVCRKSAPKATYMWSPKGDEGLQAYYPGDGYVDVIGLSVFGLQQYDMDKFGHPRSFSEALAPGYARVVGFGKPIVVAELGYVGKAEYVADWDKDSRAAHPQFSGLTSVVYFNDKEVYPWPDNYGLPDWRVTNNVLP